MTTGEHSDERARDRTPGHRSDEVDVVPLHTPPSYWTWALLLQAPVLWVTHFIVVYLAVEWWCGVDPTAPRWLGLAAPVTVTLVATAIAVLAIAAGTAFTARRHRQARAATRHEHEDATDLDDQLVRDRHLLFVGILLGPLSIAAVLAVGVPALWLPTC